MPTRTGDFRARAPALTIGSHNVRGIRGKLDGLVETWQRAAYDVILVTETHLEEEFQFGIDQRLHDAGWQAYWKHGTRRSAGVGILIRSCLIDSGAVTVVDCPPTVIAGGDYMGRCLSIRLSWGGHSFDCCVAYLHNDSTSQRAMITSVLAALQASQHPVVLGGDFNFVEDIGLDRMSLATGGSQQHPDIGVAACWQTTLPRLRDTFRMRHPGVRRYTCFSRSSASRIDRIYVSPELSDNMVGSGVFCGATHSDHRPVSMRLLPAVATEQGPGRRTASIAFVKIPHLREQFGTFLEQESCNAPAVGTAYLEWWQQLKDNFFAEALRLNRAARLLTRTAAVAAVEGEYATLLRLVEAGEAGALPLLFEVQRRWREARDAAAAERRLPKGLLHHGEQPSAGLTAAVRPPRQAAAIPAVRSADGRLCSGQAAAQCMINYYKGISAVPTTSPAAQEEVLAAMSGQPQLDGAAAAVLGSGDISEREVHQAVKHMSASTTPGIDGIPLGLYQRYRHIFAPLLARLFISIWQVGVVPDGFLAGLIACLHKSGDRAESGNYRPITLLNTDYRILAKILANRLNPCLQRLIGPEQTAFLQRRHMGDNIIFLQSLPRLLDLYGITGCVVFCDFRKAYDTLDRGFLTAVLQQMGLGEGFIKWVRLLLSETYAAAKVNGFVSELELFEAGVRQGCPLAPLLYICVAHALLCFLKQRGVGLDTPAGRFTASQYADDAEAVMEFTEQAVQHFVDTMAVFAAASGQTLNLQKTRILPVGRRSMNVALPTHLAGLRVVEEAEALGVTFRAWTGEAVVDWKEHVERLVASYGRLAKRGLSIFGRASAASGYGLSAFLFHAEFCGAPPPVVLATIKRLTARLVAGDAAPGPRQIFHGVASVLLPGRPRDGGFGVLPLEQHIKARHAIWGLRLLSGDSGSPWVTVALYILRGCGVHGLGLLWQPALPPLPQPLQRFVAAVRALPAPIEHPLQPLAPGPWCLDAPLWGSVPYLRAGPLPLEARLPASTLSPALMWSASLVRHLPTFSGDSTTAPAGTRGRVLGRAAAAVEAALPPQILEAATSAFQAQLPAGSGEVEGPAARTARAAILGAWGWVPPDGTRFVPVPSLTVRQATSLLMSDSPARSKRAGKLRNFLSSARLLPPGQLEDPSPVLQLFRRVWCLPLANKAKEAFWRLAYDAHPTPSRLHLPTAACGCGAAGAAVDRAHMFWACPVMAAVTTSISRSLGVGVELQRANLWLAEPPVGMCNGVWLAVCILAIGAVDSVQRLWRHSVMEGASEERQQALMQRAPMEAQARFWGSLAELAEQPIPTAWHLSIQQHGAQHPFLRFFGEPPQLQAVLPEQFVSSGAPLNEGT